MRIDSHQHFWKYHPVKDAWIGSDMKLIQKDFLPADIWPLMIKNNIDGCVAVQADQSEEETHFLLDFAKQNDFIKGVVGWVDLLADNIEERLEYFSDFKKLKGFRHILEGEVQDDYLLRDDFCRGISKLATFNFTYDLLILPKHLRHVIPFVQGFPQQSFVVDHLAKPNFKTADFSKWEKEIRELALLQNVSCKLSGIHTQGDWLDWKENDFAYCLDVVTDCFGTDRLLFGSDWPVSSLAASYQESCGVIENFYSKFSIEEQRKIWGGNAVRFYNL